MQNLAVDSWSRKMVQKKKKVPFSILAVKSSENFSSNFLNILNLNACSNNLFVFREYLKG